MWDLCWQQTTGSYRRGAPLAMPFEVGRETNKKAAGNPLDAGGQVVPFFSPKLGTSKATSRIAGRQIKGGKIRTVEGIGKGKRCVEIVCLFSSRSDGSTVAQPF